MPGFLARLYTVFILTCSLCFCASPGSAQESDQLYFVGAWAPLGSISAPGQEKDEKAVYLRWDVIEGDIPADFVTFFLRRDDGIEWKFPVGEVKSAAEIASLYSGEAQDRRKKEIIHWLSSLDNELDSTDPCKTAAGINETNFSQAIFDRINPSSSCYDRYWAHTAARMDFTVARAMNRAFLDNSPTDSEHIYELIVSDLSSHERLIGKTTVSISSTAPVMSGAENFKQVTMGRCDAPEYAKDHGALALNWQHGGSNVNDLFVHSLTIAGYDLYRTTFDPDSMPSTTDWKRDLRQEALALSHDENGQLTLTDLVKISEQPIVISGQAEHDERYKGWNPEFSQFYQTASQMKEQGLNPGDGRVYYLVGRDFTGNYTGTVFTVVGVPDKKDPLPPWRIDAVTETATNTFSLTWDHVDPRNYQSYYQTDREFCNLATAVADGEICYVPAGSHCGQFKRQVCVDLAVEQYLVYRFESPADAAAFKDSDGDGFSDVVERSSTVERNGEIIQLDFPFSSPGTACDGSLVPTGEVNYKLLPHVNVAQAESRFGGRKVLHFTDPLPASNKGQVYWYRIASVDYSGNVSPLSPPVRGFFPDKTKPAALKLCSDQGMSGCISLQHEECLYKIEDQQDPINGFVEDTSGDAVKVELKCRVTIGGTEYECNDPLVHKPAFTIHDETLYLTDVQGRQGALVPDEYCSFNHDGAVISLEYFGRKGKRLGMSASYNYRFPCEQPPVLNKDCASSVWLDFFPDPGDVLELPFLIDVPLAERECASVYREVGDRRFRIGTWCQWDTEGLIQLTADLVPQMPGANVCLSLDIHSENNVVSASTYIPCMKSGSFGPPPAPTPVQIVFDEAAQPEPTATASWLPPEDTLVGTIIELYMKGGEAAQRFSTFVPHTGHTSQDGTVTFTFEPGTSYPVTEKEWQEEWCIRGRSVGFNPEGSELDYMSAWSSEKCSVRIPLGDVLPEYLPWPEISAPPMLGELDLRYVKSDGVPVILMSAPVNILGCVNLKEFITCEGVGTSIDCDNFTIPDYEVTDCGFCSNRTQGIGLSVHRNFVVYRQSREKNGDPGNFIQVTPLIENPFCYTNGNLDRFEDPFFKVAQFYGDDPWLGMRVIYNDRYPHIGGQELRYQFVYFDEKGEILGYRTSNWVQAP